MKNMKTLKIVLILAGICIGTGMLAASCDTGGGGLKVKIDNDNLCSEIARIACHNMFRCCEGQEIEGKLGLEQSKTEDDCRKDLELECKNTHARLLYALEAGTAALNVDFANQCFNAIVAPDGVCFLYTSDPAHLEPCQEDMIDGLLDEGDECLPELTFECGDNAWCAKNRQCMSLPATGDPCGPDNRCADDLYCGQDGEKGRICMMVKDTGEECESDAECGKGSYCSHEVPEAPECARKKDDGSECTGNNDCESNNCVPGVCDDGSECYGEKCSGTCDIPAGLECKKDEDCGGNCSISGRPCEDNYDCWEPYDDAGTGDAGTDAGGNYLDECIHNECQGQGDCHGTPECATNYMMIDYCDLGLMLTQFFNYLYDDEEEDD